MTRGAHSGRIDLFHQTLRWSVLGGGDVDRSGLFHHPEFILLLCVAKIRQWKGVYGGCMPMIWNVRTQQRRIISKKFFLENSYSFSCDEKKSHTLGKCTYSLGPDENEGGDDFSTLTRRSGVFFAVDPRRLRWAHRCCVCSALGSMDHSCCSTVLIETIVTLCTTSTGLCTQMNMHNCVLELRTPCRSI